MRTLLVSVQRIRKLATHVVTSVKSMLPPSIAQLVERSTFNRVVEGSIPSSGEFLFAPFFFRSLLLLLEEVASGTGDIFCPAPSSFSLPNERVVL